MKIGQFLRRFFIPRTFVTVYCFFKYRAFVSPRAEVEIHPNLVLGRGTKVGSFAKIKAANGPMVLGENVAVGEGAHIGAGKKGVFIGNDCLIAPHVLIIGANYRYDRLDIPFRLQGTTNKGTKIGNNVWVGCGACVLDGAEIGDGTIITPNSVVSSRIPEEVIAQGNPAKVIFERRR